MAHNEVTIARVEARIIGIVVELDDTPCLERISAKNSNGPIATIRNRDDVGLWRIDDALRFVQSIDAMDHMATGYIDDVKGIVADLGYEESSPFEIDCEMIDTA